MTLSYGPRTIPAPYALPVSFAMYLTVGTVAAALHGHLSATVVSQPIPASKTNAIGSAAKEVTQAIAAQAISTPVADR
jgi:hypothetical protein